MKNLSKEQRSRYSEFKAFVSEYVEPHAGEWDEAEGVSDEAIAQVAAQGYLGAIIPKEYGGQGWDLVTYGLLNEAFGKGSSSLTVLFTVQNMVSTVLMKWGTPAQKSRWLPAMANGAAIASFALTEPEVGSDIKSIDTRFSREGEGWRLNGTKRWITFAAVADIYLIFGRCGDEPVACVLERNTPGFNITKINGMLGFKGCYLAKLEFDNVAVPAENIIGLPGTALSHLAPYGLHYGRLSTAFSSLGLLRGCLESASERALTRHASGTLLINHGMICEKIADMGVNYDAAFLLCVEAAEAEENAHPLTIEKMIAAKYFASRKAAQGATDAIQVLGAYGCHEGSSPVGRYYRDAKIMEIIEGTNQVLQNVMGQSYARRNRVKAKKKLTDNLVTN